MDKITFSIFLGRLILIPICISIQLRKEFRKYNIAGFRKVQYIPLFLVCICLLAAYGPLSTFTVSLRNQKGRLDALLTEYGAWDKGHIISPEKTVPDEARNKIWALLEFMDAWGYEETLSGYASADLSDSLKAVNISLHNKESYNKNISGELKYALMRKTGNIPESTFTRQYMYLRPLENTRNISGYAYVRNIEFTDRERITTDTKMEWEHGQKLISAKPSLHFTPPEIYPDIVLT